MSASGPIRASGLMSSACARVGLLVAAQLARPDHDGRPRARHPCRDDAIAPMLTMMPRASTGVVVRRRTRKAARDAKNTPAGIHSCQWLPTTAKWMTEAPSEASAAREPPVCCPSSRSLGHNAGERSE